MSQIFIIEKIVSMLNMAFILKQHRQNISQPWNKPWKKLKKLQKYEHEILMICRLSSKDH